MAKNRYTKGYEYDDSTSVDVLTAEEMSEKAETDGQKGDKQKQTKRVPFAVVEAYKSLRTNLQFLLSNDNGGNVFAVTSANAGEGKSTTAANLAVAFSQLDKKILIIDADMRKASLHKKFKVKNGEGLSNVLSNLVDRKDCIKKLNSNLYLLTAGSIPPNPSELLGSKNFQKLVDEASKEYDYVIIDTPPVNVVADCLVVAPNTVGLVFVIRDGYTPHYSIKKALDIIAFANVNVLGAIMNCANPKSKSRYVYRKSYYGKGGYGYGSGYGYGYGSYGGYGDYDKAGEK